MQTYTFVMQYLGCTYTSQVSATDINNARRNWLNNLCHEEISRFTQRDKQRLTDELLFNPEIARLVEMVNVWHFFIETQEGTGYVTAILSAITEAPLFVKYNAIGGDMNKTWQDLYIDFN